jgi:ADP-heptose:LPS heptosyltransferase
MGRNERGNRLRRLLDRWIGCPLVLLLGMLHHRRERPTDVKSIGILMFGAIGDALLASSIIHDLRNAFPSARIVAFASSSNRSALDLLEGPDAVVVTPISQPQRALALLRREPIDVLIDVGQWPRISALLAALSGSRFTIGFRTRGQCRHWAYDAVADHSSVCHEIDNFRALISCLNIKGGATPRLKSDVLDTPVASYGAPYVVFHPWASGYKSYLREWRTENWIALAHYVLRRGYRVLITGGPEDAARSHSLALATGRPMEVTVLAGQATLRETASRLAYAAAVVSVNTGIMHFAALLNRPTVALHGPTNPRRWGPLSDSAVVVGPGPDGGYLNLGFEYPVYPPDCMSRITVEQVARCLNIMLGWSETPIEDAINSNMMAAQG